MTDYFLASDSEFLESCPHSESKQRRAAPQSHRSSSVNNPQHKARTHSYTWMFGQIINENKHINELLEAPSASFFSLWMEPGSSPISDFVRLQFDRHVYPVLFISKSNSVRVICLSSLKQKPCLFIYLFIRVS